MVVQVSNMALVPTIYKTPRKQFFKKIKTTLKRKWIDYMNRYLTENKQEWPINKKMYINSQGIQTKRSIHTFLSLTIKSNDANYQRRHAKTRILIQC